MKSKRLNKYLTDQENRNAESKKKTEANTTPYQTPVDNKRSAARKKNDVILMDMPEVKDIPGQENIRPPHMREMMDITISSADEEGEGLLDDLNKDDDEDTLIEKGSNVSASERSLLAQSDRPITEEVKDRQKLSLDKTDGEDQLNEGSDPLDMGNDLDLPGTELDDDDEKLGEEDEENNSYSRPD